VLCKIAPLRLTSFGTSLTTTLWDRRASVHHATLTEHISAYNPVYTDTIGTLHNNSLTGFATLEQLITRQAYMLSTIDLFWLFGWIFLSAIPVLWLTKPSNNKPLPAAAAVAADAH
jgi:DHA2 family multidrug resistance protein